MSLAGRICLVNYSLLPVLFHSLAHCKVPRSLLSWLNLQLRCGIWNHFPEERRWHYVGWDAFTASKEMGGAGILYISAWYEALSRRQAVRILSSPENCWVKQVRVKYKFLSWLHLSRKSNISAYWKMLCGRKVIKDMHGLVAKGDEIDIWNDVWLNGTVLSRTALELRWESQVRINKPRDFISEGQWNQTRIARILGPGIADRADSVPILPELSHDRIVWGDECWTKPKIKLLYEQVLEERSPPRIQLQCSPLKISRLWSLPIPPSVRIFLWKVAIGKLPSGLMVARYGLGDGNCLFCHEPESCSHPLL